jgi:hypothetical protein
MRGQRKILKCWHRPSPACRHPPVNGARDAASASMHSFPLMLGPYPEGIGAIVRSDMGATMRFLMTSLLVVCSASAHAR